MSQNINTVDISNDANLEDYVLVSVNGSLRRVKVADLKELVDSTEDVVVVDTELSTTSVNPVQNRVITTELNKKANSSDMSTYQTKRDNTLTTTSKEVVGAINENTNSINQLSGGKADKSDVNELKEDLILYNGSREVDLNADNINKLIAQPNNYYLNLKKGSNKKTKFLNDLLAVFDLVSANNFKQDMDIAIKYLQKMVMNQPQIIRCLNSKNNFIDLDNSYVQLNAVFNSFNLNKYDTLFETIPGLFNDSFENTVDKLKSYLLY